MNNKNLTPEEQQAKFLDKEKKISKPQKTISLITMIGLTLFLTVFLIFFPFKDGSVFEIMVADFKKNTWNSQTIFAIVVQISMWVFLIWKLITRIQETKLYYKKRKLYNIEVIGKAALNLYTKGEKMASILKSKDKDKYVNFVVSGILDAFSKDNDHLSSNCSLEIRTIVEDEKLDRKQKLQLIRSVIEKEGHKIDNSQKSKAIKQV